MPRIRVDPNTLQTAASRIQQAGQELGESSVRVLRAWSQLAASGDFDTTRRATLERAIESAGREAQTAVQNLQEQTRSLGRIAQAFAQADGQAVGGWGQIAGAGNSYLSLPASGGAYSLPFLFSSVALPAVSIAASTAALIQNLPDWLRERMYKFFPDLRPKPVQFPTATATPTPKKTGSFGDLMKKSREEAQTATPSATVNPPAQAAAPEKVSSTYEISYKVPLTGQGTLFGSAACSFTSLSMITQYYHDQNPDLKTVTPEELIALRDPGDGTSGKGVSLSNLTDELNDLGYKNISQVQSTDGKLDDLKAQLKDGPVTVTTGVLLNTPGEPRDLNGEGNTIHAVVVKGISSDSSKVLINDPWSAKEIALDGETFKKMWAKGDNWMYIVRP